MILNIFITSNHDDELVEIVPLFYTVRVYVITYGYRAQDVLMWSSHVWATKYGTPAPNIRLTCAIIAVTVRLRKLTK